MSDEAAIMIRADGPYLVSGSVPLRRRTKIETDEGEPIAWRSGPVVHDGAMYALCRCGASAHKPFCDSSHADVGFDGTETADAGTYAERAKSLGGTEIEIFDDRSICSHAGFCGTAATNIWKMAGDTADTVVRSQAVAMVARCPSGAITYSIDAEGIEEPLRTEIGVTDDGPLFVTGGIAITRADGETLETRNRVALCRCGGSANKPFCDGTHWHQKFRHALD